MSDFIYHNQARQTLARRIYGDKTILFCCTQENEKLKVDYSLRVNHRIVIGEKYAVQSMAFQETNQKRSQRVKKKCIKEEEIY